MKLFVAWNGYVGFSAVHVIVVAENEERAEQLASEKFKAHGEKLGYSESYWTDLDIELLHDCEDGEYVSEVEG